MHIHRQMMLHQPKTTPPHLQMSEGHLNPPAITNSKVKSEECQLWSKACLDTLPLYVLSTRKWDQDEYFHVKKKKSWKDPFLFFFLFLNNVSLAYRQSSNRGLNFKGFFFILFLLCSALRIPQSLGKCGGFFSLEYIQPKHSSIFSHPRVSAVSNLENKITRLSEEVPFSLTFFSIV